MARQSLLAKFILGLQLLNVLSVSGYTTLETYITDYAPLVYLDVNEQYLPSDIPAQLTNTHPELNFTLIEDAPSDLDLSDLAALNAPGSCTVEAFDNCDVYLTSRANVTTDPRPTWLYGRLPNSDGATVGVTSSTIIVNDHGGGLVDAYYFFFYAFNLGLNVSGVVFGNHVGDWEHTMIRFMDGKPQTMYFSAHDSGDVYTFDAVTKKDSRPVVFASLGGHANYPTAGLHTRDEGPLTLNDTTSEGPLWDPILSACFYTYTPISSLNGTFEVAIAGNGGSALVMPDWLYFLGRWGDKQYPKGYPDQVVVGTITAAYQDGPTGPLDKDLNRTGTCPDAYQPCNTTSILPVPSGTTMPVGTISDRIQAPTLTVTNVSSIFATGTAASSRASLFSTSSATKPNGAGESKRLVPEMWICLALTILYMICI